MPISDGEIAMGLIQLVALSLPVFAVLTQVYFSMTDEEPNLKIGTALLFGGGNLIAAGLLSAHFLFRQASSGILTFSIQFVSLGLIFIGVMLYYIYSGSKKEIDPYLDQAEEHLEISKRLVGLMEEHEVETVSELREAGVDISEDIRDDATLSDLRKVKKESTEIIDDIESFKNSSLKEFKKQIHSEPKSLINSRFTAFGLIIVFVLLAYLSPISFGTPLGLVAFALLGLVLPTALSKLEDYIQ